MNCDPPSDTTDGQSSVKQEFSSTQPHRDLATSSYLICICVNEHPFYFLSTPVDEQRTVFCVLEGSISFYTLYFILCIQWTFLFLTAQIACTCAVVCTAHKSPQIQKLTDCPQYEVECVKICFQIKSCQTLGGGQTLRTVFNLNLYLQFQHLEISTQNSTICLGLFWSRP